MLAILWQVNEMTNLRAGIIGLGMMGSNHARILLNLEGVELVGVADSHREFNKPSHNYKTLNRISDLIDLDLDYCIISAPTIFHEEIALELIRNGIHFLIEKPIASNLASAKKIREAAEIGKVMGAVGHIERFNSALIEARKRIAAGELGTIYQVATRRQGPFPDRISDVGVIKDLATHDIDLTSWLTQKKYLQVSANAAFRTGRHYEDLISVTGLLEESIVVNHIVNWLSPLKERKVIITGEKGTFVVDTLSADLTYHENGKTHILQNEIAHFRGVTQGEIKILAFEKPEPLLVEHQNFRDSVLGKPSNNVSLQDGVMTLQIAEAIIESYSSKSVIQL
jgi:UDP-N-acetylglucosamine 3-dehydrogenase